MEIITREQLHQRLLEMGFRQYLTVSKKWRRALLYFNGQKTLLVLIRTRGVDLLETPGTIDSFTAADGRLSVITGDSNNRFAEYHYTESDIPIHKTVLELAVQFVDNIELDPHHFQKVGIGRGEWAEKQGFSRKSSAGVHDEDLRSLYTDLAHEPGEDVYLSDGLWLSPDGSVHDRGR